MTLYCDVDGTLLDSSARHEKLLRDLLATRGLLWPAAAPDYLRYKADGHSTKAWLMLAGFAPETCAELADAWRTGIEQPEYLALDTVYPDTLPFLQAMRAAGRDVVLISARQNADALRQTLARCGILPLTAELLVVPPVQADRRKAELLRPRIAPGDVMLGDTEVDKSCAELLGLPWIVLDRGFRSTVYWQAHGVQPARDLHEAARRLQNLP